MIFRLAGTDDLPQLYTVFGLIAEKLNRENGQIWEEGYPCRFFESDIAKDQLYLLSENETVLSAFALWSHDERSPRFCWEDNCADVLYFGRFGVNVSYVHRGIGGIMLRRAFEIAGQRSSHFLRLFAADKNEPAIKFYTKHGFHRVKGHFERTFSNGAVLCESGFEIKIPFRQPPGAVSDFHNRPSDA